MDGAVTNLFNLILRTSDADGKGLATSVPKCCTTHWSAIVSTLSVVLAKYVSVLDTMDRISMANAGDAKTDQKMHVYVVS